MLRYLVWPVPCRRRIAGGATLVWVLGLYLLPLLHSLNHRDDHSHGAQAPDHSHPSSDASHRGPAGPTHEHPHPHPHADSGESAETPGVPSTPPDRDHGDGSLLHFAIGVVETRAVTLPMPGARVLCTTPHRVEVPLSGRLATFEARGPPA